MASGLSYPGSPTKSGRSLITLNTRSIIQVRTCQWVHRELASKLATKSPSNFGSYQTRVFLKKPGIGESDEMDRRGGRTVVDFHRVRVSMGLCVGTHSSS